MPHPWQKDLCPECGEETNTEKKKLPYGSVGVLMTYCSHCLWSERDDPLAGLTERKVDDDDE